MSKKLIKPCRRFCKACGVLFKPDSKFNEICNDCKIRIRRKSTIKMKKTIRGRQKNEN